MDIQLEELEKEIWIMLFNGANRAKDALKYFTISSLSSSGIGLRTVVLRKAIIQNREIHIYTDNRSKKWKDWSMNPITQALFYDGNSKSQILLNGQVQLVQEGKIWEDAWNATSLKSRKSYMTELPPGTSSKLKTSGLKIDYEEKDPSLEKTLEYKKNFGLVIFSVKNMEYLKLEKSGNFRAFFEYKDDQSLHANWLIP